MKNLWKYLSTLGLMFVAVLCLGVGLKSNEKAEAAKDCDVYVTGGATYRLDGGSVGTIKGSGDANITIVDGSVYEITDDYATGASMRVTLGNGSVDYVYLYNGDSYGSSSGSCVVQEVFIGNGTFSYRSGNIKKISNYNGSIYFNKAPTQTLEINSYHNAVGDKVAQVETADFDLSKINFTSLPTDTKLEIQEIDGKYWIVIVDMTCTVVFNTNTSLSGGGWNIGSRAATTIYSYTNSNSVTLHFKKGGTIGFGGYYSFTDCVEGYNFATISVPTNYQIDSVSTTSGKSMWSEASPYPSALTITENTTITVNYGDKVYKISLALSDTSLPNTNFFCDTRLGSIIKEVYARRNSTITRTFATSYKAAFKFSNAYYISSSGNKTIIDTLAAVIGSNWSVGTITIGSKTLTTSSTSATITENTTLYVTITKSFIPNTYEQEAPPEIQWGIEVVMRDEDKIVTKPAVCIVPSGNEIVVRKRHEI